MSTIYHDIGIRIQCLTLIFYGVPMDQVVSWTGVSRSGIYCYIRVSKERGFNPSVSSHILAQYVTDKPRSGRPTVVTDAIRTKIEATITKNSTTRQYSLKEIAEKCGVSAATVHRVIRKLGYKCVKPTVKPALTKEQKQARLDFCKKYKNFG